jgi:hypothetical protein
MVECSCESREHALNISAFTTTGRRIVHVAGVTCFTGWQCLQAALAARLECELDDVHIREDEDGIERLAVRGDVIGYVTTEIGGVTYGIPDAPSIVPADEPEGQRAPSPRIEA